MNPTKIIEASGEKLVLSLLVLFGLPFVYKVFENFIFTATWIGILIYNRRLLSDIFSKSQVGLQYRLIQVSSIVLIGLLFVVGQWFFQEGYFRKEESLCGKNDFECQEELERLKEEQDDMYEDSDYFNVYP